MNFDFTIIGGSFAGMTTALALTQVAPELKIAIIERQDILNSDRKRDGRAYAISSASLQLFKEIGIYDMLQTEAGKISDIKITDYKSPFFLDFLGQKTGGDFGQIIENYQIHNALRNQILQQKNISVFAPNFYQEIEFVDGPRNKCGVTGWESGVTNWESGVTAETAHPQHVTKGSQPITPDSQPITQHSQSVTHHPQSVTQHPQPVTPHLLRGPYDVTVKLNNGTNLNSKLLLACDGRFSQLRETYQIHTTVKKYGQTAIVFNISHALPHQNIAHEKFLPGGPLAILPLKNPNHSSIVWIAPEQTAQAILALDEENFIQQLMKKMEDCLGETKVISEKFSYPLGAIEAEKFFHKKMLLIGDAACGVHPIAGQGFNLAISGIKILCELVKENLYCGLDISAQNLIDTYNKKAKSTAKKMLIATDILNSLFETKNLSISLARDLGLGIVNKIPQLKKFLIKSAGGF